MKVTRTYFMLMVSDMARSVAFYRDVIGLSERFSSPGWSELAFGDAVLALHGGRSNDDPVETGLGLYVEDADAACNEIEAAGGTIVQPPEARAGESIKLAIAADPDGNCFSLAEPVSHQD